jgi:hypothetical protein
MNIKPELRLIADSLKLLKNDGIIRTKNLVGDLGEYYCSQLLNLTLNNNVVEKGYDAKDSNGKKVEIKTRRIPEKSAKINFKSLDFDYYLYIELNEYFEPREILKIPQTEISKNLETTRNRLSVGKLKAKTKNEKVYSEFDKESS